MKTEAYWVIAVVSLVAFILFVLLKKVVTLFSRWAEQAEREEQSRKMEKQKRLFEEKWGRMLRVDTKTIAQESGMSVGEVEKELGWPSLWKSFAELSDDLITTMMIGRRLYQEGVTELLPLWQEKMDILIPKASLELLLVNELLVYYSGCPKRRDLEKRLVSEIDDLQRVFAVSRYLSTEGKKDCKYKIERVIQELANGCKTPDELRDVAERIPREVNGDPICTCKAIGIVVDRAYDIYRPKIKEAQSIADLDKLKIPDLGEGRGECLNLLRCELQERYKQIRTKMVRELAAQA